MALVQDRETAEAQLRQRLLSLAGAARQQGTRPAHSRCAMPRCWRSTSAFPTLRAGRSADSWSLRPSRPLAGLIEAAIEHRDEELIDHCAARLAVRAERSGAERLLRMAASGGDATWRAAPDAASLDRRACAILRARAAAADPQSARARCAETRSPGCCSSTPARPASRRPETAAELLARRTIHVRAIAVRALTGDDPRALPLARRNRELLLARSTAALPGAGPPAGVARARQTSPTGAEAVQQI